MTSTEWHFCKINNQLTTYYHGPQKHNKADLTSSSAVNPELLDIEETQGNLKVESVSCKNAVTSVEPLLVALLQVGRLPLSCLLGESSLDIKNVD